MKNSIIAILSVIIISFSSTVFGEDTNAPEFQELNIPNQELPAEVPSEEFREVNDTVEDVSNTEPAEIENTLPDNAVLPHKQPTSKKRLIKMFIKMMFGVVVSSVMIYVILTVYNKLRMTSSVKSGISDGETPLDVPDNLNGAVKIFLEKTKW